MHRFPHQHFPHPVRHGVDAVRPFDSYGDLAAINTNFAESNQTTSAGSGEHKIWLRCQYGNKSSSSHVLHAEEPAIPFLFRKTRHQVNIGESDFTHPYTSLAVASEPGRTALRRVNKSTWKTIHRVSRSKLVYGGSLSYVPMSSAECEGLLFRPHAPDLLGLSMCPISYHSSKDHYKVPVYPVYSACKPYQDYTTKSCVLQIETLPSSTEDGILTAIRTDNSYQLLTVTLDNGKLICRQANTVPCDHKPTAVALSPYLKGECLISHENGTIDLIGTDKLVQSVKLPGDTDTEQPCWSHYGSHPRLVLAHQLNRLDLLDIRVPSSTPKSTCLMSLPSDYLASNQDILVTSQHPVNHFYHFVATQDMLVLVDERFPKYHVLQWQHYLDSPPSCIDVVSQALPTDDLAVVSSFSSGQSHCFQFSCLNGETPISTSPLWKVSSNSTWLDALPEIPVCHGLDDVKSRLQKPLVGMCVARHSTGKGLAVFQVSEVGDVFQHTFYSSSVDQHKTKTVIPRPGNEDIQLSEESLKKCKRWMEDFMFEKSTNKKTCTFRKLQSKRLRQGLKKIATPNPNCQICQTKTSGTALRAKPQGLKETCPACGVQINTDLYNCLKRTRTSLIINDTDIITSKIVPVKESNEELPWEQLQYDQYTDAIGCSLLKHWQFDETEKMETIPSSETPVAHPPPSSSSPSQPMIPKRLRGFLDSTNQLTQVRLATASKSPQKKITARRKLLNPVYTLGF